MTKNGSGQWLMALGLVGILAVAMAPLPAAVFDLLIGVSLCLSALRVVPLARIQSPSRIS